MNKVLSPNGGLPVYLDDLNYEDVATRDAFKGILHEVALQYSGNMILGGCELTIAGSTVTVAAGYIMIDYEVCYFAGTTFPTSAGTTGYFALSATSDIAGQRTLASGASTSPWQTRRATFTGGTLSGGALDYPELKRLKTGIYDLLVTLVQSSTAFTVLNGWTKAPSPNDPQLYKHFRTVSFAGDLIPSTITQNTWTKITTLPTGYRPAKRVKAAAMGQLSSSPNNGVVWVDILTNGEVYAQNSSSTAWDLVTLNIQFFTA